MYITVNGKLVNQNKFHKVNLTEDDTNVITRITFTLPVDLFINNLLCRGWGFSHSSNKTLNVDVPARTLKKPNNLDIEDLSIAT